MVVYGVISATRGVVHWHIGEHSFNAQDICDALREIRATIGDGVKIAMAMDNARIHRAKIVQELMATEEVDMKPVWNVTARPDLLTVGIEQVWARAKHLYRCAVDRYKAINRTFHHIGLVQHILGQITNEFAMKVAAHSVPAVQNAEPIQPLATERMGQSDEHSWVYYSPDQKDLDYMSPFQSEDEEDASVGEEQKEPGEDDHARAEESE